MEQQIFQIDCPDEKGLVYRITEVLYRHRLNITSNQEFVDADTCHFVMRTAYEGDHNSDRITKDLESVLPDSARIRHRTIGNQSVVIMATKEPHCLGDLLLRYRSEELFGQVSAVISNHQKLEYLANAFEVPFHCISHQGYSREEHEDEILEVLDRYNPDYIILAKYMRIFTPAFVARFAHRLINIHHSFLPAFTGARPYEQAYDRGVKIIGATAHFVTDELDEGPIIAQDVLPINHSYTAGQMANAGRDIEKIVLAKAVKLVLQQRVFIHGKRTIVFE